MLYTDNDNTVIVVLCEVHMRDSKKKRWRLHEGTTTIEQDLVRELGIYPVVAHLLANRGIESVAAGREFLYSTIHDLVDPFTLLGMKAAIETITAVIEKGGHIVVYGDYDVDGITATSLMYRCLKRLGASVSYYIPERQSEGYGLNLEALETLISRGTDLIITVDCGISSYDIVEAIRDRIDIIITDHHMAPPDIPRAKAVINHKQPNCPYKDKNLSGVGVAFKICQALWLTLYKEWYLEDLDIVALGTVADVVPLVGENRIIVQAGLRKMNENPNLGIKALIRVAGLEEKEVGAGHIGFTLAPRLNAAGRVTHATRAVELLITHDEEEALTIAEELQATNSERQQIERSIYEEARASVIAQGHKADKVIVVAGEGWHPGVIGIVASRLVEEFYKPTMVISIHDGVGKGSCRSIENCNIYEALKSAEDLLLQFGGHHQAAGFSIDEANIDALRERLTDYCERELETIDYTPIINIDAALAVEDVTIDLVDQIATLEPYGMGNSTPIFAIPEATVDSIYLMGFAKNHCKFSLGKDKHALDAVAWQGENYYHEIFKGDEVQVAFSLQKNEWQGNVSPQLIVQDMSSLEPQREILTVEGLRHMYRVVKGIFRAPTAPKFIVEANALEQHPPELTDREAMLSLDVFKELGILQEETTSDGRHLYRWIQTSQKLDLVTSLTFLQYSKQEV